MYAIIRTGGKQYRVTPQTTLNVARLDGEPGSSITIADVLAIGGDKGLTTGAPLVNGASVTAEIVRHFRDDKILVFKKQRRQNYRRRRGHRQDLTAIRIVGVNTK